jgi:rSAM/selenodomain-associated transferase 1
LNRKQLGIFVRTPVPGAVKTRLCPPLSGEEACRLYAAFLEDLSRRLEKLSGMAMTVFYEGDGTSLGARHTPRRAQRLAQDGDSLGDRLVGAFAALIDAGGGGAVIIGSDSPDLPIQYIRRAFQKLRHHDVVLGPAADGGYYLVGLAQNQPDLFKGISWGSETVYAETLAAIERERLSLATLPLWYDVDSAHGLSLLRSALHARKLARRDRLIAVERVMEGIDEAAD